MFDIGFGELLVVAVVALVVVGPQRLPGLLRTVGRWMGRARHFASAVKTEFEREVQRTEDLKRLVEEQQRILEQHQQIDPQQLTVPVNGTALTPPPAPPESTAETATLDSGPERLASPVSHDAQK